MASFCSRQSTLLSDYLTRLTLVYLMNPQMLRFFYHSVLVYSRSRALEIKEPVQFRFNIESHSFSQARAALTPESRHAFMLYSSISQGSIRSQSGRDFSILLKLAMKKSGCLAIIYLILGSSRQSAALRRADQEPKMDIAFCVADLPVSLRLGFEAKTLRAQIRIFLQSLTMLTMARLDSCLFSYMKNYSFQRRMIRLRAGEMRSERGSSPQPGQLLSGQVRAGSGLLSVRLQIRQQAFVSLIPLAQLTTCSALVAVTCWSSYLRHTELSLRYAKQWPLSALPLCIRAADSQYTSTGSQTCILRPLCYKLWSQAWLRPVLRVSAASSRVRVASPLAQFYTSDLLSGNFQATLFQSYD